MAFISRPTSTLAPAPRRPLSKVIRARGGKRAQVHEASDGVYLRISLRAKASRERKIVSWFKLSNSVVGAKLSSCWDLTMVTGGKAGLPLVAIRLPVATVSTWERPSALGVVVFSFAAVAEATAYVRRRHRQAGLRC